METDGIPWETVGWTASSSTIHHAYEINNHQKSYLGSSLAVFLCHSILFYQRCSSKQFWQSLYRPDQPRYRLVSRTHYQEMVVIVTFFQYSQVIIITSYSFFNPLQ